MPIKKKIMVSRQTSIISKFYFKLKLWHRYGPDILNYNSAVLIVDDLKKVCKQKWNK